MLLYKKCTTWKAPTREAKRYGAFSSPKLYERIQKNTWGFESLLIHILFKGGRAITFYFSSP
jgi:hypothetical protein